MIARFIMKARLNSTCEVLIVNLTNITLHVPKYRLLRSFSDSIVNNIDPEQVYRKRCHRVPTVQITPNRPFKKMKVSMPQTAVTTRRVLSKYLHNTLPFVLDLSKCSVNSKKFAMFTVEKPIQLPIQTSYPQQKPK